MHFISNEIISLQSFVKLRKKKGKSFRKEIPANIVIIKLNPPDLFKFNIYTEKILPSQKDI